MALLTIAVAVTRAVCVWLNVTVCSTTLSRTNTSPYEADPTARSGMLKFHLDVYNTVSVIVRLIKFGTFICSQTIYFYTVLLEFAKKLDTIIVVKHVNTFSYR